RGSQGVVRGAGDEIIGREVALKELLGGAGEPPDKVAYGTARARFLREVRLIASLEHPGIVAIHELARRDDGTLFCAQKLIRGETLRARMASARSLNERSSTGGWPGAAARPGPPASFSPPDPTPPRH